MSASEPVPVPPRRTSGKTVAIAVIVLIVTFVSGAFSGILVDHLVHMRRGPRPHRGAERMMIRHLDRALDLTDAQRVKIEEILRRRHERMWQLSEGVRPRIHEEVQAANAEIERVLTPEQREKFQKLKMRLGPHERHPGGRRRRGSTR